MRIWPGVLASCIVGAVVAGGCGDDGASAGQTGVDGGGAGGQGGRDGGLAGGGGWQQGDAAVDAPADVPPPPCDASFTVDPTTPTSAPFSVRFTHASMGLTNIALQVTGPGAPAATFEALEADTAPFRWRFVVSGHAPGRIRMVLVADPNAQEYGRCEVDVSAGGGQGGTGGVGGSSSGGAGGSGCTPDCSDKLCGADDGCGTPCAGGHRDAHGGVSDCRASGNCGCGVEPNDNMVCGGDGQCTIRCSCDCLPPQQRPASAVAGLDHSGSCELVFRESGDPTVWDSVNNQALCPLGYDPQGAARCTECPPCHRDNPQGNTACTYSQWCECRDPMYVGSYQTECCNNGICF